MFNLRASVALGHFPRARRLGWIFPLLAACSVYDPTLLGDARDALTERGGSSSVGGKSTSSGGTDGADEGGKRSSGGSDAGVGGEGESGGTNTGGMPSLQGGSVTTQGGSTTDGGNDTGGSVATGGSATTGGTTGKGGTTSTGGISATGGATGGAGGKGGAAATGGTMTGGAGGKGGATSTGGTTTGGTMTGGAGGKGGTTSTGGTGGSTGGTDGCPNDPNKTAPGVCGCGILEQDSGSAAGCLGLKSAIVHRYTFAGNGTTVSDSIGSAHGSAVNCTLASGSVTLASTTPDQYIDLPNKILSPLTNATIEVWVTWGGGANWQRLFDFGNSTDSEGVRATGATYLLLSPKPLRAAFSLAGIANETGVTGSSPLPTGVMSHVSVVVNDSADLMSVFLNGASVGSTTFTGHLSALNDVNTWLGRSQFSVDAGLAAVLHEVRIYNAALTAAQLELTERTGPDPAFF